MADFAAVKFDIEMDGVAGAGADAFDHHGVARDVQRAQMHFGRQQHGEIDEPTSEKVKAYSAATDNVGLFFGEDIFIAIGSIVLIQQTLLTYGYNLSPLHLAVWAIPSAIAALFIHGARDRPRRGRACR